MKIKTSAILLLIIIGITACKSSQNVEKSADHQSPKTDYAALKDIYKDHFLVGNIVNGKYVNGEYLKLLTRHFNTVTCENEMKPGELAPNEKGGQYNWAPADRLLNEMAADGIKVHGHALVWHNQTHAWMTEGNPQEVREKMANHINTVLEHYKGRVLSWDVVNEAFLERGNSDDWRSFLRTESPWFKALGDGYIEFAFRTAREADPDALLYYNDYNMDNQRKVQAVAAMIKEINDKYRDEGHDRNLIDGIGLQAHYSTNVLMSSVRNTIQKFGELGLIVDISELDVVIRSAEDGNKGSGKDSRMSSLDQKIQANVYASLFKIFMENSKYISRVTMWGMDDESSWKSYGNPCLWDFNLNPKQAFFAVSDPEGYLNK